MKIGDLRHRLTLQARTRTPDGAGGFAESWAPVAGEAVVYAAIRAVGGGETLRQGGLRDRSTYKIILRWRDDITPDMRLSDGVKNYDITGVLDRDGRKQYLEVTATCEG